MQVMLDGRRFPPAEASNKKLAKKVAAAETLRALYKELEGTSSMEDEAEQPSVPLADLNDFADDSFVSFLSMIYLNNDLIELGDFCTKNTVESALSVFPLYIFPPPDITLV